MAFGPNPPKIQAHLCVKNGQAALDFYKQAFGAATTFKQLAQDGKRILHANVSLFGGEIMLHDEFAECSPDVLAPESRGGASFAISVNLAKASDVDDAMKRAELAGANVSVPAADQFWGARYGRICDPFGHVWAFNAPLQQPQGDTTDP